jgi:superfamily I DNA and/or RNA helicase
MYDGRMIPGRATWNLSTLQDKLAKTLRDPEWAWELFSKARLNGSRRVWFIDVPGFSEKAPKSSSASNPNSVNVTSRLASWISDKIGQDEVHVISMYSHEIGLILDQLSDWNKPSVDVQTVDCYQGKEGEAIVIHGSAAWKNRRSPIGFLTDIRHLSVGITRAKSFMFIVGNFSFWESRITTLPNDTSRDQSGKRKFPMKPTDEVPRMLSLAKEQRMLVHYSNIDKKRFQDYQDLPRKNVS